MPSNIIHRSGCPQGYVLFVMSHANVCVSFRPITVLLLSRNHHVSDHLQSWPAIGTRVYFGTPAQTVTSIAQHRITRKCLENSVSEILEVKWLTVHL
jgi:hypothetical protein